MNKFTKAFSVILFLTIFSNNIVFAVDWNKEVLKCNWLKDYDLYKCEVNDICKTKEYWANNDKIINLDKFYKENTKFEDIKKIYRNNQNNIYKCSVLNSQEIALVQLITKLLNSTDKTGLLKTKIIPKIISKKNTLQNIKNQNNCVTINIESENKKLKKIVLDQSALELCNYNYYLKYLNNSYYTEIGNIYDKSKQSISSNKIEEDILNKQNEIETEIKHSYKMFPLAFDSYLQYDSFLKTHIVLELLKEDYRVYRDKLYQTLNPINQLVYKIINAQSK